MESNERPSHDTYMIRLGHFVDNRGLLGRSFCLNFVEQVGLIQPIAYANQSDLGGSIRHSQRRRGHFSAVA